MRKMKEQRYDKELLFSWDGWEYYSTPQWKNLEKEFHCG